MEIESEKKLERKLRDAVKLLGGWALKMPTSYFRGLPDRMCLLPGARVFFAEIKTTGKKPTRIQKLIHAKLRRLGFEVYVVDKSTQIIEIVNKYAP